MSSYVNVSNSWRNVKYTYVKVSGSWRSCLNVYVNSGGWHPLYYYWWSIGAWGGCSVTCGGGWQYRAVYCYRSHIRNSAIDTLLVDDYFCTKLLGPKPATSQVCNTHPCITCLAQRGSASYICQKCNVSCPYNDCYFIFDRIAGEYWYFWGYRIAVTWNYAALVANGYYYSQRYQLWYDGYTWVYEICRQPV